MTAPGRKRRPKGDAKGDSIAAKDDQSARKQRAQKADLIARFRAKNAAAEADQGA